MILVTGFGPYKESANASGALVGSLAEELPPELAELKSRLAFEVISVDTTSRCSEHEGLESQLLALLEKIRPELCVYTGQAPPYNKIAIEKIATNTFMREIIDPGRPVAYWSDLPGTDGLRNALEQSSIPASYSFYAGQHLCNHILYSSRYFAESRQLPHRSGFIHVPVLPEQVTADHRESPFMPLDMTRRALSVVLLHVYRAFRNEREQRRRVSVSGPHD